MKKMALALLLVALFGFSNASAQQPVHQHDLDCVSELFIKMVNDDNLSDMMERLSLYEQSGFSYQPQLAVPLQVDCKDDEQLRTLAGMFIFDSNLALAFGHTKEALATKKFVRDTLLPRMHERDKIVATPFDPAVLKTLLEDPSNKDALAAMRAHTVKETLLMAELAKTDPEVMELLVETLYGAVIQGVYVAVSMAQDVPMTPELVKVFNSQVDRLELLDEIIDSIGSEEYKIMLEYYERDRIVDTIKDTLKATHGKPSAKDLQAILTLATKSRSNYATPCQ